MAWYYAQADQQKGPVDEAALDELVRQGVVRDDTLVWREGMGAWQPHGSVRHPVIPPLPSSSSTESRYCSECGRPFPANELYPAGGALVCAGCRPAVMQRMSTAAPGQAAPNQVAWTAPTPAAGARHYGGFWIRFLGRCIDWIIIAFIGFILRLPFTGFIARGAANLGPITDPSDVLARLPALFPIVGLSFLLQVAVALGYEMFFLSTRGATPGKMALRLKVIRADGGPISGGLAAGRYFGMWLSTLIFWIGYIIAAFDPEKRALHDHICQTRVIYTD